MATGLLVVLVGNAVKLVSYYQAGVKRYLGEVTFGTATDTDDAEGEVVAQAEVPAELATLVSEALARFTGVIRQRPPSYCAVKVGGQRLHRRARKGEKVEVPEREVTIFDLSILKATSTTVLLEVECGSGTYIRSLARDLGETLGTVAHLSSLRRVESAPFSVAGGVALADILDEEAAPESYIGPVEEHLPPLETVELGADDEDSVRHGRAIPFERGYTGRVLLLSETGQLVAVGIADADSGQIRVKRVIDT